MTDGLGGVVVVRSRRHRGAHGGDDRRPTGRTHPPRPAALLGTVVTEDPDRARVAGFFIHMLIGQGFALGYAATFALLDRANWWLGGLLGLLHAAVALTVLVPLLPGVHPRMASERAGPAQHRRARTSRSVRPQLRRTDSHRGDRRAPRLRHSPRRAPRSALRGRAPRASHRGLRATRRHPHRGARRFRRRDRLDVCPPLRRAADLRSARRRTGRRHLRDRARRAPQLSSPPVPPGYRHAGDDVGEKRRPAHADRSDDRRSHGQPAAHDPAGSAAHRERRTRSRRSSTSILASASTTVCPRVKRRGEVTVCSWGDTARRAPVQLAASDRTRTADDDHHHTGSATDRHARSRGAGRRSAMSPLTSGGRRSKPTNAAGEHGARHRSHAPHREIRRAKPAHPAPVDLLAVRCAGRGSHDVAARASGRDPQLGLSVRLAPGRQHRRRRLPRHRQDRRSPRIPRLAPAREPARATTAAGVAHPSRSPSRCRTGAPGWPGYAGSDRCGSATAPRTSISSTATAGSSTPPGCSYGPDIGCTPRPGGRCEASPTSSPGAGGARRRDLGDPRRRRPPRPLQADGLARPRPRAAHRRHPPPAARHVTLGTVRAAIVADVTAQGFDGAAAATPAATARPTSTRPCSSSRCSVRAHRLTADARHDRRHRPRSRRRRPPRSTATRPDKTASPAARAPSCRARSGSSKRSPPPAGRRGRRAASNALLALASPLGLYAEEMDPSTDAHLGNYPQALTHAALIQAALALRDKAAVPG